MIDEEWNIAIEEGEIADFTVDVSNDDYLTYGDAWDEVERYLKDEYNVSEFWQHRTLDECDDFMSGFINGAVWIATHYPDDEEWAFEFITYDDYEEYYN